MSDTPEAKWPPGTRVWTLPAGVPLTVGGMPFFLTRDTPVRGQFEPDLSEYGLTTDAVRSIPPAEPNPV